MSYRRRHPHVTTGIIGIQHPIQQSPHPEFPHREDQAKAGSGLKISLFPELNSILAVAAALGGLWAGAALWIRDKIERWMTYI